MESSILRPLVGLFSIMLFTLVLTACGGGDGGSGSASLEGGTGNVALLLTDGPTDDFDEINITVIKAELFCDSGHISIFEGEKTFNLLNLADHGKIFAAGEGIPAGYCSKIRLTLTSIELVKKDDMGNILQQEYPSLPGNGKLDLVPRGSFHIAPGETIVIQIDMDAEKSIHIVETGSGNRYQFRPVVFVDVIDDSYQGKYIRVHGTIGEVDAGSQAFELCKGIDEPMPVPLSESGSDSSDDEYEDSDYEGCIDVSVVDATAIFDESGKPTSFDQLVKGNEATVYGRLRKDDDYHHDGDEDEEEDDDEYEDSSDSDSNSDDDKDEYEHKFHDLELVALVVELGPEGTFDRLKGVAQGGVDEATGQFSLLIDPDQNIDVTVQVQEGTKIVDRKGEMRSIEDIVSGMPMMVEGVVDEMVDPNVVYAAFIVLDVDGMYLTKLSGTVNMNPADVCGGVGLSMNDGIMDRDVRIDSSTLAFLVSPAEGGGVSSAQMDIADIAEGQTIDVYGSEGDGGCFNAEIIIAFAPQPQPL